MTPHSDYCTEHIRIVEAWVFLPQLPECLAEEERAVVITRYGKSELAVLFESIAETFEIMANDDMMAAMHRGHHGCSVRQPSSIGASRSRPRRVTSAQRSLGDFYLAPPFIQWSYRVAAISASRSMSSSSRYPSETMSCAALLTRST